MSSSRRSRNNWNPHIWFEGGYWLVNVAPLRKGTNTRWTYSKNQKARKLVSRLNGETE